MKKNKLALSIILFGLVGGLSFSVAPDSFEMVKAADVILVDGSYCSTDVNASKNNYSFYMLENDAPYKSSDWSIRYRPQSADCVTITRNGVTRNLATNTAWDMITKCDATKYLMETWMMGDYKPQLGDIYTIKGDFLSRDTVNNDPNISGKYKLRIKETSFIVSGDSNNTYFAAIPKVVVSGGQATMPTDPNQQWYFLFNLNNLDEEEAPVTGDTYGYYPTNSEDVYIDGAPVAKVNKPVLKRRESGNHLFYVCFQNELQGWNSLIKLDSLVVFSGTFAYQGNVTLEDNKMFGFSLNEVAFHKIGEGINDYEVVNFREYLINKIRSSYDLDNYIEADKPTMQTILDGLDDAFITPTSVKEVYALYNQKVAQLDSFELDPEVAARILEELKRNAIHELDTYVVFNDYFPNEQQIILDYISVATFRINQATNKQEIIDCVAQAKANIDTVKKKEAIMTESILTQADGYEQYLRTYNRVSLDDLNLDEQTFHGKLDERKSDLNTNRQEDYNGNTFIPKQGNTDGNVIFQFNYVPNAIPHAGANMFVNLRGIPLYGYKFAIDTDSRGCYVERLSEEGSQWYAGTSNAFTNGQTHFVEVGALDLIELDLTWLFIRVNGALYLNRIVDSLSICINPRVAISSNDNKDASNDYEGTVVVSNNSQGIELDSGAFGGLFMLNESLKEERNIYCSLDANDVPFDIDNAYKAYPLRRSSVKLIRDEVETDIGNPSLPVIEFIGEGEFRILTNELVEELHDGDKIVIDGVFSLFNEKTHKKTSFNLMESTFVYHESTASWEQILSLDTYKVYSLLKLENYADFDNYEDEEVVRIKALISLGTKKINAAETIDEVKEALFSILSQIDDVKTIFVKYQDRAVNYVNEYKSDVLDQYRNDEIEDMLDLKKEAVLDIRAATTEEEVDEIVAKLVADIDKLRTDEEYKVIELEDAKTLGVKKIQDHYAALNPTQLSGSDREVLNADTLKAISDIKDAKTVAEIDQIIENYSAKYPLPKEKAPSQSNNASLVLWIVIPSVLLLIGGAVALVLILKKRKKVQ